MASRQASAPPAPSSITWPGPHSAPGRMTLRLRISHPLMPTAAASRSSTPSMANCAWLAPKPRNAPHTRLLVRAATASTSTAGHVVRPGGVAGGPLEHLHPDRRVGAGVADRPHPHRRQHAVGVAAGPVLEAHRVALGVDAEALLARQRALHRPVEQPGGEGRRGPGCSCPPCRRTPRRWRPARRSPGRSATPSTRQMSSRSSHTPWPPEYTCSVRSSPAPDGTASVDSGSRKACSMRWVWKTSWTVWALAASRPSTSPRA